MYIYIDIFSIVVFNIVHMYVVIYKFQEGGRGMHQGEYSSVSPFFIKPQ